MNRKKTLVWLSVIVGLVMLVLAHGKEKDASTLAMSLENSELTQASMLPDLESLKARLGLDEEQVEALRPLLEEEGAPEDLSPGRGGSLRELLMAAGPVLDDEQFAALVEELRPQGRWEEMAGELGLSEEQMQALHERHAMRRPPRPEGRGCGFRNEGPPRMSREGRREAFEEILSPEQLEKLQALREERREQRMQERSARHLEFLSAVLKLDEGQVSKLEKLEESRLSEMREQREADQQRRQELREKAQEQRTQAETELKEILSEEQWARWQALTSLREGREMRGPRRPGGNRGGGR